MVVLTISFMMIVEKTIVILNISQPRLSKNTG